MGVCANYLDRRLIQVTMDTTTLFSSAYQWLETGFLVVAEYTRADAAADPGVPDGPEIIDRSAYPDEMIARTDYIAMMAGIEIPDGAEADAQADAPGVEPPGIEGDVPRSENYDKVKRYYKYGCWNAQMVRSAAGRWITEAEAVEILDDEQTEGE